jgi:hypothetical protein
MIFVNGQANPGLMKKWVWNKTWLVLGSGLNLISKIGMEDLCQYS